MQLSHVHKACLGRVETSTLKGFTPHLLVRSYSFAKVSQQVVCVAEVAAGSTLSSTIPKLLH